MRGPPDPKSERAALPGSPVAQKSLPCTTEPVAQKSLPCTTESTETVPELQARSLRHRFALGYYFAATVAHLAFAVSR
jgi:hypothetical protein